MDGKEVLNEREKTHGVFSETSMCAQELKDVLNRYGSKLPPQMREALDMKASKWSRILCGDHMFEDHWLDDAGYSHGVLEWLSEVEDVHGVPPLKTEQHKRYAAEPWF